MTDPAPKRGRPHVADRAHLEAVAFRLLLHDGYAATTVDSIAAAAGVGRTTLFRYFGSKAGIVWGEFDRAVERLDAALEADSEHATLDTVRHAIVESTRLSREAAPDSWLDRFRVIDGDPALTAESAAHWRVWADRIARHILSTSGPGVDPAVAAAAGSALQAAYVVILREWCHPGAEPDLAELPRRLAPICTALQALVDG